MSDRFELAPRLAADTFSGRDALSQVLLMNDALPLADSVLRRATSPTF